MTSISRGGSGSTRLRVFDSATLIVEVLDNDINGPLDAFVFDVIETRPGLPNPTLLDSTVFNNTLSNIGGFAMLASSVSATSEICMDLLGNSPVADYQLDATSGTIEVTTTSQAFLATGSNFSAPISDLCPIPAF